MYASSGLFRYSVASLEHFRVLVVDECCKVASVVEDQVQMLAIFESAQLLFEAPVVLVFCLSLPSKSGYM
jgi:hypothetical protein